MLVLARRINETVHIIDKEDGDKLIASVTIVEIRGQVTRLGFVADRRYDIKRHEISIFNKEKKDGGDRHQTS